MGKLGKSVQFFSVFSVTSFDFIVFSVASSILVIHRPSFYSCNGDDTIPPPHVATVTFGAFHLVKLVNATFFCPFVPYSTVVISISNANTIVGRCGPIQPYGVQW